MAFEIDAAGEVIARFGGAVVGLQQRVEEHHLDGLRGERGQIQNLHIDGALAFRRVNGDMHGDHVGARAEDAGDGCAAILGKSANGRAGVDDLESVVGRGQRGHHIGGGHGQGDRPRLQNGMAAGQQPFGSM